MLARTARSTHRIRKPAWRAALGALLLAPAALRGDAVAYSKVVDLRAESDSLLVEHHHDWSPAAAEARRKWRAAGSDPFGADNTFSTLTVLEKPSGRRLFESAVPALTDLWISPDSRYVVGLSTIKLSNPVQLVVFDRSGRRLYERGFLDHPWPGISESVTNAIHWYKGPTPRIRLEPEPEGWLVLFIEDPEGTERSFRFRGDGAD